MINFAWAWVALVYVAAVWLARRCGARLPWRVAGLFYALVLVFFFRPMTQTYVNYSADIIRLLPPWSALAPITPETVSNYEMQDVAMQMVPWAEQVRQSWRALRFPLWNELAGCGYPLLANGQSAALSPLRLAVLPLPLAYSIAAEAALKLLVAMSFTFLFCRRRFGELPSIAGAISFGFATFLIVWLHFPHSTTLSFLPAAIFAADLLLERPSWRRITAAALAWTATLFAGHPETTAHMAVLIAGFVAWTIVIERRYETRRDLIRGLSGLAAAAVATLLLASPFLVPFAESLLRSKRFDEMRGRPAEGIPFSDKPSAVLLVQPRFYGALRRPAAWGPAGSESISGFAGILGIAGLFAILARAFLQRRWRERELFFALMSVALFAIIVDWAPLSAPFRSLFSLANNSRVRGLLCFCSAIQAAALLEIVRERRMAALTGVAAGVAAMVWPFWEWRSVFHDWEGIRPSLAAMTPSLVVLALLAGATFRRAFAVLILPAVLAELWLATAGWHRVMPVDQVYWRTPLIRWLETYTAHLQEPFRIAGIGDALFPNTNALYGFEDVRVHDPMANARYVDHLRRLTRYDPTSYYAMWNDPSSRLLNFLNARFLVTGPGIDLGDPRRYALRYDGVDGRIYENRDVLPRFFVAGRAAGARVAITRKSPTDFRLRVESDTPALVVSSQPSWPGWRVTGAKRVVINDAFLGFVAPPGRTEVRVDYLPLTFYVPLVLSLMTLALLMIQAVASPPHP